MDLVGRLTTVEVVVLLSYLLRKNVKMVHITIDDNSTTIFHQETFMVEVVFETWMLNRSNMVRADVEEDTNIECESVNTFD